MGAYPAKAVEATKYRKKATWDGVYAVRQTLIAGNADAHRKIATNNARISKILERFLLQEFN